MKTDLFAIFCLGVDYGQLIMEEERDNEDIFDGFQGYLVDRKYGTPFQVAPRRQPHSEKWREAKRESYKKFLEIINASPQRQR